MDVVLITVPNTFAVIPFLNKKGPIVKPLPIYRENALKLKEMGFDVRIMGALGEKKFEEPVTKEPIKEEKDPVQVPEQKEIEPQVSEKTIHDHFSLYEGEFEAPNGVTLYTDPEGKICSLNEDGSVKEYYDIEEETEEVSEDQEEEKTSSKKKKRHK